MPRTRALRISVLFLFLMAVLSSAQDLIILRNGDEISGKVLKVSDAEIEYRKAGSVDGPVYALAKNRILMIRYKNGTKDIMANDAPAPTPPPPPPAGSAPKSSQEPGYLGVALTDLDAPTAQNASLPANLGVLVGQVVPNSAAERSGLAVGDILTSAAGTPLQSAEQARAFLKTLSPGQTYTFDLVRNRQKYRVSVTMGTRPQENTPKNLLGVVISEVDEAAARNTGLTYPHGGLVTQVVPGSPADRAKIVPGDVIFAVAGTPVRNAEETRTMLADLRRNMTYRIELQSEGGKTWRLNIPMTDQPTVASANTSQSSSDEPKNHGVLGVGYIDYLNDGFGLALHGGGYRAGGLNILATAYYATSSSKDAYSDLTTTWSGFAVGPTFGLNDNGYLYVLGGFLAFSSEYSLTTYDNYGYEETNSASSSDGFPLMEIGAGVVFGHLGFLAGYNVVDFDFGEGNLHLAASISW